MRLAGLAICKRARLGDPISFGCMFLGRLLPIQSVVALSKSKNLASS